MSPSKKPIPSLNCISNLLSRLYKNGMKEDELRKMHRYRIKDNYVIFDIKVGRVRGWG